jgi:ABC-2 type transport system permease protein
MNAVATITTPIAQTHTDQAEATRFVVARLTAKKAVRSGVLWGYLFGIVIASSALTYSRLYKTQAQRDRLAATYGSNKAIAALFGAASKLQSTAGFTEFKVSMTLMILGALWGLLTSTRLLRGEEDAGRWELLLTGRTTRAGATAQALTGLFAGVVSLWGVAALLSVLAGRARSVAIDPGSALFLALAMVGTALMFLAVGALTSQVAATRRQAAAYAAVLLGLSYGLRLLADAGVGLHGLIWLSPLGWVEEIQPLTSPNPWPLLLISGFSVLTGTIAVWLAGRRDLGSSAILDRSRPKPNVGLLSGQLAFSIRRVSGVALSWMVAIAATGFLLGMVARGAAGTLSGSAREIFSRLGASGTGVEAYLGISYVIVAVLICFVAAGQMAATRAEEADGHLDHLLLRPVSRGSWFGGRVGVALVLCAACGALAGLLTWLGTASQGSGVGLGTLLEAGVNAAAPALCVLGVGAAAFGIWPRTTAGATYTVVCWSLLVEVVGGLGSASRWLLDTSVFHQIAAAPAVPPDWTVVGLMGVIGVVGAAVGAIGFRRRDLRGY